MASSIARLEGENRPLVRKLCPRPSRSMTATREAPEESTEAPKIAVAVMGAVMTLFAVACAYAYDPKEKAFLDFALGVLNFAFSASANV